MFCGVVKLCCLLKIVAGVAEIAGAIGRGQAAVLPGRAAHERQPHRQQTGRHRRRFVADGARAPVIAERRESDVADRQAGDHVAVGVGPVLAEDLAVLGGVGLRG